MRVCIALLLFFASSLNLMAEERSFNGLVDIDAKQVNTAHTLVSGLVIPAIDALSEWAPTGLADEDKVASFRQQLIAPKIVFTESINILQDIESYLHGEEMPATTDLNSLKIMASAQFCCLEIYSIFCDPLLPIPDKEREQVTVALRAASKVYLGSSDLILTYYSSLDNKKSPTEKNKIAKSSEPEYASIPYKDATLLGAIDRDSATNSFTKVCIQSNLSDVTPSDIDLFINSREGKVKLYIDAAGICHIPLTDELLEENPQIISNQPQKTLILEAAFIMNDKSSGKLKNNKIRYNELMRPIQEANDKFFALEETGKFEANALPMVELLIQYPEVVLPAEIVIELKSGDVSIPITEKKSCKLSDKKSLRDENPWIKLPPHSFNSTAVPTTKPDNWEEQ